MIKISDLFSDPNRKVAVIETWEDPDSRSRDTYVVVDRETLELLRFYLEEGVVVSEIRDGLEDALRDCPEWSEIALEDLESFQRQNVVGRLLISIGERIEPDLDLIIHLY